MSKEFVMSLFNILVFVNPGRETKNNTSLEQFT